MISSSLILILTIIPFYKVNRSVIVIIGALALATNLYSLYLEKKPANIGNFKTPFFEYKGEGVILFGNSIIKLKNGCGLVVVDHKTSEPLIKIERKLDKTWPFLKRDKLVVSGEFWDNESNQVIKLQENKWHADPKLMWNSEMRDDLIKIYGSDPNRDPILLCQLVNEKTIKVECKSKIRDLYFSATKNGITVNGFGFIDKMTFEAKEHGIVKFLIGGPLSPIVFEAEGPGFVVSGYKPPFKSEKESLFAAILVAPEIEVVDWKKQKISRPDVPFREHALKTSWKIGKLPNSNVFIWNAILYHDQENEFYLLLRKSRWYVGETYKEAQTNHPDIMVYAMECEIERTINDRVETIRLKMADMKDGDKVLKRNLHPQEFLGFEQ
jgi:hypothetical protein